MRHYDGPSFVQNNAVENKVELIRKKKRFPNYLENNSRKEQINQEEHDPKSRNSAFTADNVRIAPPFAGSIPFYQQKIDPQKKKTQAELKQERILSADKSQKRQSKQDTLYTNRLSTSGIRAFKRTNVPPPLHGRILLENDLRDYAKLAEKIIRPSDELLLFEKTDPDANIYSQESSVPEKENRSVRPLAGKTKRAMNRSLEGIMENEPKFRDGRSFLQSSNYSIKKNSNSYFS